MSASTQTRDSARANTDPHRRYRPSLMHWRGPDMHCQMIQVARVILDEGWRFSLRDPFWRLYRNEAPGATLTSAGRRMPLAAHRSYVVPAGVAIETSCTGSVDHLYIHFLPIGWSASAVPTVFTAPLSLPSDQAHAELLRRVGREPWDCALWMQLQAELLRILAGVISRLGRHEQFALCGANADIYPSAVAVALRAIEERFGETLSVTDLARESGVSPEHLSRLFRVHCGTTPMRWIHRRRAEIAADLLISEDCEIDEAARRTGHANRFHFTRVFTRVMGVSPAAYRRTVRIQRTDAAATNRR